MSHLPVLRARAVIRALEALGFIRLRQRGSHVFLRHPRTGRSTVVPVHVGEDIDRGLLRCILREVDLDVETFLRALGR
ncbi:type II toxin-antitoxin system HicA family toxin [Candidatus Uhrbacteria bacterium]|nr:type II toxin-antitoxin system HicA family toxin [Candidatus Uhrbacteria bacterium]